MSCACCDQVGELVCESCRGYNEMWDEAWRLLLERRDQDGFWFGVGRRSRAFQQRWCLLTRSLDEGHYVVHERARQRRREILGYPLDIPSLAD